MREVWRKCGVVRRGCEVRGGRYGVREVWREEREVWSE